MITFCNPPYIYTKKNIVALKDHGGGIGYSKEGNRFKARKVPILDFLYGYKILETEGYNVKIADDQLDPSKDFDDFLDKYSSLSKSNIIFIRLSQPTLNNDFEFAKFLKKKNIKVKLVAFGPVVQNNTKWFYKDKIFDYFISSEIEAVIKDFAKKIFEKFENVDVNLPGIYSKIQDEYVCNEKESIKADLQSLPHLPYNLPEFKNYVKFAISSRGCPIGCTYCPYILVQNKKFRFKTPDQVIEELSYYQKLGIKRITFRDPNFGHNNQRVQEICKLYIEKKLKIEWDCETVLNTLKDETIILMGEANCKLVRVGIETVSPKLLELAKRPNKLADINIAKNKIKLFKNHGTEVYGFFVIGFEGDKLEYIKVVPKVAKFLNLDRAQFMTPNLYPGIDQYNKAIESNLIDKKTLNNLKLFSNIIGNHANINFSLAKNIDITTLHIGKKYCERLWYLLKNNKSKKISIIQFIKYRFYILIAFFVLNNIKILKPIRSIISENK